MWFVASINAVSRSDDARARIQDKAMISMGADMDVLLVRSAPEQLNLIGSLNITGACLVCVRAQCACARSGCACVCASCVCS